MRRSRSHNARHSPAPWPARAMALALFGVTPTLSALEPVNVFGAPVAFDITNTSTLSYNVDNRDTRPNQVATLANDDWGLFYNRLNVLANGGAWQAGLRLDNAWFFSSPNATQIALDLWASRPATPGGAPAPVYFRQKLQEAGVELSNRYINWMYPAKYYFTYTSTALEVGVGDVYVAFGRGLVLSLRKLDELASDTTLRGARVTARVRGKELSLRATAVAGSLNPLRIDPASGRYLGVDSSVTPGFVKLTEAGMPRAVATDFVPDTGDCKTFATCSYAPDRIFGAQAEVSHKSAKLAIQGSWLERSIPLANDVVRSAERITTGSASFELADLGGHGGAYLELALQDLHHADSSTPNLALGQAAYLSVNV